MTPQEAIASIGAGLEALGVKVEPYLGPLANSEGISCPLNETAELLIAHSANALGGPSTGIAIRHNTTVVRVDVPLEVTQ